MKKIYFLLPALAFISFFLIYPIFGSLWLSLHEGGKFVGLKNYKEVLTNSDIIDLQRLAHPFKGPSYGALIHNLLWMCIQIPITIFLGSTLAYLLREKVGETVMKAIIFSGMVIPGIITGFMFRFIYQKQAGIVNEVLRLLGFGNLAISWLAHPKTALFGLIIAEIWVWTGQGLVIYSASLEGVPQDVIDAAKVDGASSFRRFFSIVFPLMKPATVMVTTLTLLEDLKGIFDIVYAGTMGGPGKASTIMSIEMYLTAFRGLDFNNAAVISIILTIFTIGFMCYIIPKYVVKKK